MTPGERGFLLLTSHLGDPERKILTTAQFRVLAQRVRSAEPQTDLREMQPGDLSSLGYSGELAERIIGLLAQEALLERYLRRAETAGCGVLTRISGQYPQALRARLGTDAPGCLWYRGSLSILDAPMAALVGSRDIRPENREFARQAGIQAAEQGFTLVSGNARGADKTAQDACLEAGGRVISVVAGELFPFPARENILYLSEDSFDLAFSPQRALSRNRVIHALPHFVLVAQSRLKSGGTWDAAVKNLRQNWSNVFCFRDGAESTALLEQMGAEVIGSDQLNDLRTLSERTPASGLFDQSAKSPRNSISPCDFL